MPDKCECESAKVRECESKDGARPLSDAKKLAAVRGCEKGAADARVPANGDSEASGWQGE